MNLRKYPVALSDLPFCRGSFQSQHHGDSAVRGERTPEAEHDEQDVGVSSLERPLCDANHGGQYGKGKSLSLTFCTHETNARSVSISTTTHDMNMILQISQIPMSARWSTCGIDTAPEARTLNLSEVLPCGKREIYATTAT